MDIVKVEDNKQVAIDESKLKALLTRAEGSGAIVLHTFDDKKLEKLAERMPEIHRANRCFGRQNTQHTNKIMTLNMICCSPYRQLRQCLAQIERKQGALKENYFKINKEKVEIKKIQYQLKHNIKMNDDDGTERKLNEFDKEKLELDLIQKASGIEDSSIYIEGALKELGSFTDAYEQIRKSNDIPKNWDEEDVELAEIGEHVRMAFNHGIRDILMTGRLNVGTMEYLEQHGIEPIEAVKEIMAYITLIVEKVDKVVVDDEGNETIVKEAPGTINNRYDFLDTMYEKYKGEIEKVMKRIGLKSLANIDWLYKETV